MNIETTIIFRFTCENLHCEKKHRHVDGEVWHYVEVVTGSQSDRQTHTFCDPRCAEDWLFDENAPHRTST